MKNKLLLTSALTGLALAGATASNAETKISGGMTLTYAGITSSETASTATRTKDGLGREVQLDIRNSGDLNNGWKYAAGFSMEQDGSQTGFDGGEQNFIDFINGNTTISWGMDHMPNMSSTIVPRAGKMLGTATQGIGAATDSSSTGLLYKNDPLDTIYTSFGVGIMQKVEGGVLSFNYVPHVNDTGTFDTGGGDGDVKNSGYEATFNGTYNNVGIKLGYKNLNKDASGDVAVSKDATTNQIGLSYKMGNVAFGAQRNTESNGAASEIDITTVEYGVAFAASDKLTISASYAKSDKTGVAEDEKITEASVGYNLGAVGVVLQYAKVENANGSATAVDGEKLALRLSTAF
jgi:hypothetical protein